MAEEIPSPIPITITEFSDPTIINNIFYSQRRLYNIRNSDNSISVGYQPSPTDLNNINPDQIVNVTGVGNLAVLGSFGANSNAYNPGQLSLDQASLTNGNNRISNSIFNDPNYYSLITNSNPTTTSTSPAAGTDGFGDSSVSRATVSAPTTKTPPQNTYTTDVIRYPLNINQNQDHVKFNVVKLKPKSLGTVSGLSGVLDPNQSDYVPVTTPGAGTIIIGTQAPIYDNTSVGWGDSKLDALQLAGANASVNMATGGNPMESFNNLWKDTGIQITKEAPGISGILGAMAVGLNPTEVFSRSQRKIINPNLELLFSGPSLRPFNFTFKFSAREKTEAQHIKKIIKFFKQNMVPRVDDKTGLFLQAPYVFTIQYRHGTKEHKSINLISDSATTKACALLSCDVNYTPNGTYMTFDDDPKTGDPEATMVAYELNLRFQEIEPIYSSDYDKGPGKDHSIGY